MRELFPSRAPFIPRKCCASLYRHTAASCPIHPSFPPLSAPLPRSSTSFFPREIAHLSQENEIFFTPCKLLAYGEMNATQRAVLRNILREDLVCI